MDSVHVVDLLVIGGGIAGGTCALRAADAGLDVLTVVKSADPRSTATEWAQGGIVAEGDEDPPQLLIEDILEAGDRIGWERAAEQLAELGPELAMDLLVDRLGVPFDREPNGEISRTVEAAHSRRRIMHVGDGTGHAIQEKLTEALLSHEGIKLVPGHMAVDLITRSHHDPHPSHAYAPDRVLGAYVLDEGTGEVRTILARCTVLATGGLGQIFLHTTNPESATGDGVAMAHRAGLAIRNLEYVQFHPTAFFSAQGDRFLISEAVRGEGAWLLNSAGERFMERYAPGKLELAPRDELARAIHEELAATGHPCVYLDLANHHREGLDVPSRFPQIANFLRSRNLDLARDPIPVVPAAHYACGGVLVDLDGRVPGIGGLYAVGEVSCTGLHGANRLASTSLLEGLVWGWQAGSACLVDVEAGRHGELAPVYSRIPAWDSSDLEEEVDPILFRQDWNSIKNTMWNYAGIVRTTKRLKRACDDLGYLSHRIESFYRSTRLSRHLLELRNGIVTARAVAEAARRNPVSIGCHYLKE
jgi:L-aspartate oxidase